MKELLSRDPSLNEVLAALGYTKRKKDSSLGKHELYKDDRLVFTGHTGDIWEWLKNIGERDRGVALVQIAIAYDALKAASAALTPEQAARAVELHSGDLDGAIGLFEGVTDELKCIEVERIANAPQMEVTA